MPVSLTEQDWYWKEPRQNEAMFRSTCAYKQYLSYGINHAQLFRRHSQYPRCHVTTCVSAFQATCWYPA